MTGKEETEDVVGVKLHTDEILAAMRVRMEEIKTT